MRPNDAVMRGLTGWFLFAAIFFVGLSTSLAQQPAAGTKAIPAKSRALPTDTKEWKGDFDGMIKRQAHSRGSPL
jgi:hypothetical protein